MRTSGGHIDGQGGRKLILDGGTQLNNKNMILQTNHYFQIFTWDQENFSVVEFENSFFRVVIDIT